MPAINTVKMNENQNSYLSLLWLVNISSKMELNLNIYDLLLPQPAAVWLNPDHHLCYY